MSSRFVISTLNGMFIAQLAAWFTVAPSVALTESTHPPTVYPALLSRADDDPDPTLDDTWQVVIPGAPTQPGTRTASQKDLEGSPCQGD